MNSIYKIPIFIAATFIFLQAQTSDAVNPSLGELNVLQEYDAKVKKQGHINLGKFSSYFDDYLQSKNDFAESSGFTYLVEFSPQFQLDAKGDVDTHINNETNLILRYNAVSTSDSKRGNLLLWYQFSNTWSALTTSDFNNELGILSPSNGGDTAPANSRDLLQHFSWEQYFLDDSVRMMAGKLTTRVLFNLNKYAEGDRADFFTPMLVNNNVVHYTARIGVGLFAEYKQTDWYLSGMIRDADADLSKKFIDFDSLNTGNWETVVEYGYTPSNFLNLGPGNYRFTYSHSDATDYTDSTSSFSISFDQEIYNEFGLFARYSTANNTFRDFDESYAAGLQILSPLGFVNDRIGVGFWHSNPTDKSLNTESGIDTFWKIQVTPFMEISPGLQYVINPSLKTDKERVLIAQLRLRILL